MIRIFCCNFQFDYIMFLLCVVYRLFTRKGFIDRLIIRNNISLVHSTENFIYMRYNFHLKEIDKLCILCIIYMNTKMTFIHSNYQMYQISLIIKDKQICDSVSR